MARKMPTILLTGLLLVSCTGPAISASPSPLIVVSPTTLDTISPPVKPTATVQRPPSSTASATTTSTQASGIHLTAPFATLSATEALAVVDLLAEKPNCLLPCWNGLTPGVSNSRDVVSFFARLGITPPDSLSIEADGYMAPITGYPTTAPHKPPIVRIAWRNEIVQSMTVYWEQYPQSVTLTRLTNVLGLPEEVLITDLMDTYAILLSYPTRQVTVFILGSPSLQGSGATMIKEVCWTESESPRLEVVLYAPGRKDDVRSEYGDYWSNWSSVLGLSIQDLLHTLEEHTRCLPYPG